MSMFEDFWLLTWPDPLMTFDRKPQSSLWTLFISVQGSTHLHVSFYHLNKFEIWHDKLEIKQSMWQLKRFSWNYNFGRTVKGGISDYCESGQNPIYLVDPRTYYVPKKKKGRKRGNRADIIYIWHDLWPLNNSRLDVKVTVGTFVYLSMPNRVTLLFCHSLNWWHSLTFNPLTGGRTTTLLWTFLHLSVTYQHCYFFAIWNIFKFWPSLTFDPLTISRRRVTLDTFEFLPLHNKLTLLFLNFEILSDSDLLWSLTP